MATAMIRLRDSDGKLYRWSIYRQPRVINCTLGQKSKIVSGWQYRDHDGYERFVEGTWRDVVPAVKLTAENYGLSLMSELS